MAQSYTRQSTFSDGDTITAALFNDEYNQLLNAFAYSNTSASSTGHRHDGTAGEGGNIHTIGDLDFLNKIVVDSTNNRWGFYVEVSSAAVEQIRIQDGAMIPVTDSDVDLGTSSLYWKDAYIDSVTTTGNISIGGNLTVTGNATISGNLTFGDADTDSITLTADVASHITPDTDDTYDLGSSTKEWRDIYIDGTAYLDAINFNGTAITATAAELNILDGVTATTSELNILDGVTATATELNIMDGDTTASSTTLADADRVVVNDNGTMKQVALTDFETYFETSLDTLSNVTTVGALNSGSITSGFGAIDTGSSNITTTGTVSFGSLTDGAITITAFVDEDNMASDSASLVPTQQSVKAYVDSQIGGVSSSLSGLSDTNITSPADGALLFYDTGTSNWIDNVVSGDITIADTGVAAISSGVIVNDDINASAAISVSKTALTAGTGLTLTTNTLSVDAAQTQITSVGTLSSLSVSGTLTLGGTAITSTAAELNILDGVTSTAAELNILDGVTATTAELNYTDGVTSNIQTQLDAKVGATYTGDVDITGELLVDSYNETFKKLSTTTTFNFNISNTAYDSKTVETTSQDTRGKDIFIKPDGTSMYIMGDTNNTVYQYTLSTAWDVSTASYASKSFSVSQESAPYALHFKSDGTKMYVSGAGYSTVFQYTLSTAWDVSTASYDSVSYSHTSQATDVHAIRFKPDGTKLYVLTDPGATTTIWQHSLSTAWDLSTASYDSVSLVITSQDVNPEGMDFNHDGTKLYVVGAHDDIREWTLSTAYNLSTASYNSTAGAVQMPSTGNSTSGVFFKSDDSGKFYITDLGSSSQTHVRQYSPGSNSYASTLNCENANVFEIVLEGITTITFSNPPASGTPVGTEYELSNASYDSKSFSVATQETIPVAVDFNSDGTKMFVIGVSGDDVNEYTLSSAFDVSTATYSQNFSVAGQENFPQGLRFNSNGTKMFVVGSAGDDVNEYNLTTGFDVSTASYSQNFSVSSQDNDPRGIAFNSDGTKMFMVGQTTDTVYQYSLTTGFDLSTASYASVSFSVASQDTDPTDITFSSDGTVMFICGQQGTDEVHRYTLSTGFDLSTASFDISFSVASQETAVEGIAFNNDGSKMYIIGQTGQSVYQYSTVISNLNDSTAYAMSLKVVQDSEASGYTVTWPTSVDWPAATAPTLTATASAVDQFVFYTYDGGTTWYGFTAGQALG